MYDYIIIGGGISGLYAQYILRNGLNNKKKYSCLLLEKNKTLGGRILSNNFHNTKINLGAGIGDSRCKTLFRLLDKLDIKYSKYKFKKYFLFYKDNNKNFDIDKATRQVKKKINEINKSANNSDIKNLTIKEFIIKYFGSDFFRLYALYSDYYDYFNSDIMYYYKYYDITENFTEESFIYSIDWNELIDKLTFNDEKLNYEVVDIKKDNNTFIINNQLECKNIIFALTQKSIDKINRNNNLFNIIYSDYIKSIQFVRIYTYHKNKHNLNINGFTINDTKLQKIIPINDHVVMISYSDNFNATYWLKIYDKNDHKLFINKLYHELKKINLHTTIDDFIFIYWREGVHYFKPIKNNNFNDLLDTLQHPVENIYVVGEFLSLRQGLVDGSLQSVERIKLKNNY